MSDTQIQSRPYWPVIRLYWKIILLGISIGTLLGGIAYFVLPAKWEVEGVIQIGQIGGPSGQVQGIESMQIVIERLKSPAFILYVAQRAGRPEIIELLDSRHGGKGRLKVHQIRNSSLLQIKVHAGTAAQAKLEAELLVDELASRHYKLAETIINEIRIRLTYLELEVNSDKKNEELFAKLINNFNYSTNTNIQELLLLLSSKGMVDNRLATTNRTVTDLKIAISPLNTIPTRLVEPISLPFRQVFPRSFQLLLLGALLGLIFSIIWITRQDEI